MDSYQVRNQADNDENDNLGSDTDEDEEEEEQLTEDKGVTHNKNNNESKSFHQNLFTIHLPQQNQLPG